MIEKPELLAPAGTLEKLKYAVKYGADAVYMAGERFGLRAKAGNFDENEMKEGIAFAHEHQKKVYVTMNIFAHNEDFLGMEKYIKYLQESGVDGVIVADPGVLSVVKKTAPSLKVSISTQANNTNHYSANFWHETGASRIVLARELSLSEIGEIRQKTPKKLELETFVHGAMCMSYSGRCLLSNYMANRDANRGDCAQPCRWNYTLMEEKRPGEHYPIYEDERGTYIFNSKDLCLIDRIPQLISAGVDSLKIEGRMKSLYYVASVVRTYRLAIDEYVEKGSYDQEFYRKELTKVSHRDYTEGFAFDKPSEKDHNYDTTSYIRDYDFVAMVTDYNASTQTATLQVRNKISEGDVVEILSPQHSGASFSIQNLRNEEGESIPNAPHPQQKVFIQSDKPLTPWDLIRKKR